ncbi:MAG: TerB family tellurite resistance protein [Bacteroidales bacterium]|nr:TerB family tellurite resistance protein [Bacteroidales bacterium]
METNIKTVASFLATAIWADGVYAEDEKVAVSEIAEALEYDEAEFNAAIDAAIAEVSEMSEKDINEYLKKVADQVADEEIGIVFEAALEIVLADGVLSEEEVTELLVMASALGLSDETAILLLSDMVKEEPDLKIEL